MGTPLDHMPYSLAVVPGGFFLFTINLGSKVLRRCLCYQGVVSSWPVYTSLSHYIVIRREQGQCLICPHRSHQGAWHTADTWEPYVGRSTVRSNPSASNKNEVCHQQCLWTKYTVTTLKVTRLTCKSQSFVESGGAVRKWMPRNQDHRATQTLTNRKDWHLGHELQVEEPLYWGKVIHNLDRTKKDTVCY